jgi:hypothetical protein
MTFEENVGGVGSSYYKCDECGNYESEGYIIKPDIFD